MHHSYILLLIQSSTSYFFHTEIHSLTNYSFSFVLIYHICSFFQIEIFWSCVASIYLPLSSFYHIHLFTYISSLFYFSATILGAHWTCFFFDIYQILDISARIFRQKISEWLLKRCKPSCIKRLASLYGCSFISLGSHIYSYQFILQNETYRRYRYQAQKSNV